MRGAIIAAVAVCAGAGQHARAATLIDFESIKTNSQFANVVSPGVGVEFGVGTTFQTHTLASSGSWVAHASIDGLRIDAVGAEFTSISGFWFTQGVITAKGETAPVTLSAFSSDGVLIDSVTVSVDGTTAGLKHTSLGVESFAYFTAVSDLGGDLFLDDFQFNLTTPVAVPLPSGAALGVAGLTALACGRRRRNY